MNEIDTAESMGYLIGQFMGFVIAVLILGVIIAFIGKFLFPKSTFKKRYMWGIIISVALCALSFCARIANSLTTLS